MKFLSVFCVVLCLRSGALLHIPSNAPDLSHRIPQERFVLNAQNNARIPMSSHEYLNSQIYKNYNEPSNRYFISEERQHSQDQIKSQYIKAPVRTFNDAQISQREEIVAKPQESVTDNLRPILPKNFESKNINPKYLNSQQNIEEKILQQNFIMNQGQHIEGTNEEVTKAVNSLPIKPEYGIKSVSADPKSILSGTPLKGTLLMPMDDTKFELQPVSPDYIKSLFEQQETKSKNNYMLPLPGLNDKFNQDGIHNYKKNAQLPSKNNYGQLEATYQNPTAEPLYNMQRALPYEIRNQQLPKMSQEGVSFNKEFTNQARIKNFEKLLQPSKRYMIIHPDGRIEHVDEIEKIIRDYPHYTMISSQDFLNHIEGKNNIQTPQLFSNIQQKSVVNQQNQKEVLALNKSVSQVNYPKGSINLKPHTFQTKVNTDNKDLLVHPNQTSREINHVISNNTEDKLNTEFSLSSTSQVKVKKYENIEQSTADVNVTLKSSNLSVGNTLTEINGNKINNSKAEVNQIGKMTSPEKNTTVHRKELDFLYEGSDKNRSQSSLSPETHLSSTSTSELVNVIENVSNISIVFENITNIKPIQSHNITRMSNCTETNLPINISLKSTTNVSENYETSTEATISSANIDDITSKSKNSNISSPLTTKLSNEENSKSTGFWFQADEHFWRSIMDKNDTRNLFYFVFVPPKSNTIQKETTRTLYPNGTILEEVRETIDEDGVPRETRTTTVFVNSTSTNVMN